MIKEILGTDLSTFVVQFFFAFVGVAISLLMHANMRDQGAPSTPQAFSWSFLIYDNWKRIVLSVLLIYVFLRFFTELTGMQISFFWCMMTGLGLDKISQYLKDKATFLEVKR